jgi:hypothetical protein
LQLGPWQICPEQTPLWQSLGAVQLCPGGQSGHVVPPPQSTPLSLPFFTPSLHVGARQVTLQTPLRQSEASEQSLPTTHLLHAPPQSTSVSVPFLTVSLHAGARQVTLQTPLVQSEA